MEITGALQRNDLDKWEIVDDEGRVRELSSGSACAILNASARLRKRCRRQ